MPKWVKIIDQERCIGCHACTVACKAEHSAPLGVTRTYVKQVEVGSFPHVTRHFQVTRCNQCDDPPCVHICPVTAMFQRPDGVVDFDREVCIGCKACIAACPYDAIYIDPQSHSAEKCNFCAHRIDISLEPACVAVCPERAILVGDILDPESEVSQIVARRKVEVRRPEKGTQPKLFYVGGTEFALRPWAAMDRGIDLWSERPLSDGRPARTGDAAQSVAAAILAYDVPKKAPWGWHVSLYTWTKSVAAGVYLLPALFGLTGLGLPEAWGRAAAGVALAFLALTSVLLVADLTHPWRFWRILYRPQWRSWLARGAYVITAYGVLLTLSLFGGEALRRVLLVPTAFFAAFTAVYTAFLFAQAKGRDLWQNPLLPLHLLVHAVIAGAAALAAGEAFAVLPASWVSPVAGCLVGSLWAHLALLGSEWAVPHATADAARAFHHMTRGAWGRVYWWGVVLAAAAAVAGLALLAAGGMESAAAAVVAAAALAGLYLYEHAYVHAGQSVPLA